MSLSRLATSIMIFKIPFTVKLLYIYKHILFPLTSEPIPIWLPHSLLKRALDIVSKWPLDC